MRFKNNHYLIYFQILYLYRLLFFDSYFNNLYTKSLTGTLAYISSRDVGLGGLVEEEVAEEEEEVYDEGPDSQQQGEGEGGEGEEDGVSPPHSYSASKKYDHLFCFVLFCFFYF